MIRTVARRSRVAPQSILLAAIGVLLALMVLAGPPEGPLNVLVEGGVYALFLLYCLSRRYVRRHLRAMGALRLAALGLFLSAAVGAQLYKATAWTYPMAAWTMYSEASPSQIYPRYEAELASGEIIHFPFDRVSPSSSNLAFMSGFSSRLREVAARADGSERDALADDLDHLLSAVAELYNNEHPGTPIRMVHAHLCTVPLDGFSGEESAACELIVSARADR